MFKNCLIVVGCSISLISATAFAQSNETSAERSGYYVDASYILVTAKDTSTYDMGTWKPTLARITLGKEVNEHLAIEGFIAQGINSDTQTYDGYDYKRKVNNSYGIAVRPFIKATDAIELYGRVGWLKYKQTDAVDSVSYSADATFSVYMWSLGVAYKITDNISAIIDYSKLQQKVETYADTSFTAVGVRYRF